MAVQKGAIAETVDHRLDVVDLPVDRIRLGVSAPTAAPPVVADDGEVRGKERGQIRPRRMDRQCAVHQDKEWPFTLRIEGDRRPVGRTQRVHHCLLKTAKRVARGHTRTGRPSGRDGIRRANPGSSGASTAPIDVSREFGYGEGLADVLNLHAQVVAEVGDAAAAESIFRRALSSSSAEPMDRCGSWLGLGGLAAAAGDTDDALTMFRQALALAEQLDLWYERARAADGLALVHDLMGDGLTTQALSAQAQAWYGRVGAHEAQRGASEPAVR
jgi:hypothetical protein